MALVVGMKLWESQEIQGACVPSLLTVQRSDQVHHDELRHPTCQKCAPRLQAFQTANWVN